MYWKELVAAADNASKPGAWSYGMLKNVSEGCSSARGETIVTEPGRSGSGVGSILYGSVMLRKVTAACQA
tara:strand:- start:234 stop:443 length:210 start_codon:yes stop_codon:yes gene_type:complete